MARGRVINDTALPKKGHYSVQGVPQYVSVLGKKANCADAPPAPRSVAEWLNQIGAVRRQGNHLSAFDLSCQALEAWPDEIVFEHQAILALARAGALGGAMERYNRLIATGRLDDIPDTNLAANFAGLGGRLFKDLSVRSGQDNAQRHRLTSARVYEAGCRRFGGYYLAINAATMYLAAGRADNARDYARIAHRLAKEGRADYWKTATQAEALLIFGDLEGAQKKLDGARRFGARNFDELAATRRQLAWVAGLVNASPGLLDHLPGQRVVNLLSREQAPVADIRFDFRSGQDILAFGPLLTATDLFIAKWLLENGAKIHMVLPCAPKLLVARIGAGIPGLPEAFDTVLLHKDTAFMLVTEEGGPSEPAANLLCQRQARGLALLRARSLAVTPELLSIAGNGVRFEVVSTDNGDVVEILPASDYPADRLRKPHAILFGDVRGFSKLTEFEQLEFLEHVIGGFAEVLDAIPATEYAETAGDGLFIVLSDVVSAVECCFALRAALRRNAAAGNLATDLGIRLSAHIGPLYQRLDRVIGRNKFCGMEVIRTARIEPVTPVGEIFVTEQFAASLACVANDAFICEYVGLQPMEKGFGECRMYSLRRGKY